MFFYLRSRDGGFILHTLYKASHPTRIQLPGPFTGMLLGSFIWDSVPMSNGAPASSSCLHVQQKTNWLHMETLPLPWLSGYLHVEAGSASWGCHWLVHLPKKGDQQHTEPFVWSGKLGGGVGDWNRLDASYKCFIQSPHLYAHRFVCFIRMFDTKPPSLLRSYLFL